ncbi:hypothetical protein WJX77_010934 [Trebouxia sp. C0004]
MDSNTMLNPIDINSSSMLAKADIQGMLLAHLMERSAPPTHADYMPVNYEAAMYAAQARQLPVVPFSPEEVSRRRTADARGTNRGSAINPNRRAPVVTPAGRSGNIGMPPIPARAESRTGSFDIAKELKSMKFSITCTELIKQSPGFRQDLLGLVNDMDEEDRDEHMAHGNRPLAQGAARGASDTAVSHAVVRRLGLKNVVTPTAATFSTAGGGTEAQMGVLKDFPIQIGSLMLKIDAMVTPADNYTILVGNDWLRMAESDLLLSKGVLRVRLNTDQWEDIPIDTAITKRPTSFMS